MNSTFDYIIVGAGIVGLSVARELRFRQPTARILIIEKESGLGFHASGRNSGVMHCGIYYGTDTLKAKVCAEGAKRMIAYAQQNSIAVEQAGKVILASSDEQLPIVERLMTNARENGIHAERIGLDRLKQLEPAAAEGAAIFCKDTAVIDSKAVLKHLCNELMTQGVVFEFDCEFQRKITNGVIRTSKGKFSYGRLINCAGAYADQVAKSFGLAEDYALVPFKGIYWKLSDKANHLVRSNIYPVPDISLPFLGVHLTRVVSGDVYVGPTAIPALGRENYGILRGSKFFEASTIGFRLARMYLEDKNNFRKLAHLEMGKYFKRNFLSAAQKLVPSLTLEDFVPTEKCGIRPQLINKRTGKLEMDFMLESTQDSVHVLNAISPAFTSAFSFSEFVVERAKG
ncbi:L-2-hydroxyglutarate oxidase [Permianibacter aggregans]|uniref:L-2-hydroxyglutarate oxidase LhgO n=1 Tax=Permianibacter aggregans TaxID=1510150 RepID=A0A4R6UXU0_9GAMM|nr:L-2-hydroxyglutarate oxidase [Permianibacter aggregans]QGX41330.1 L-2-hydroxyglutarate oxidase [Permianibacter aggregans]TDQ51116.1 L-2-hydroxyglutarate oxidase LhgO [Permianibacter aggregans]